MVPSVCYIVLLFLIAWTSSFADDTSCLGYTKGDYAGNVTSQTACRTACQVAEGFPEPDFKTATCDEGTQYDCACKKCDSSNANCEYRDLCQDPVCSATTTGWSLVLPVASVVLLLFLK